MALIPMVVEQTARGEPARGDGRAARQGFDHPAPCRVRERCEDGVDGH